MILWRNASADAAQAGGYGGGELLLHPRGGGEPCRELPVAGSLLAFRTEDTHEVLPVTHGRRFSVASWLHRGIGTGHLSAEKWSGTARNCPLQPTDAGASETP